LALQRYETDEVLSSSQNGFIDLVDWLGFLSAREYLVGVLRTTHSLSALEAMKRSEQIIPHVRLASGYIQQSLDGPPELSFLPAYYAILNLMKVYVLLGPRHADLPRNRWHGATYDVGGKDSHSVLTEEIVLKKGGVFPLFYECITGRSLTSTKLKLRIRDFLGYVTGITYEYTLATGARSPIRAVHFAPLNNNGSQIIQAQVVGRADVPAGRPHCLRDYKPVRGNPLLYLGPIIGNPQAWTSEVRQSVATHLLYRVTPKHTYTIIGTRQNVEFPQELPIALLFFYMSSVVRYRPELFSRLRDSKFWPVLSCARVHSFLDFLVAFWSFVHRRNYYINSSG
jgi:hypothetical protein